MSKTLRFSVRKLCFGGLSRYVEESDSRRMSLQKGFRAVLRFFLSARIGRCSSPWARRIDNSLLQSFYRHLFSWVYTMSTVPSNVTSSLSPLSHLQQILLLRAQNKWVSKITKGKFLKSNFQGKMCFIIKCCFYHCHWLPVYPINSEKKPPTRKNILMPPSRKVIIEKPEAIRS